MTARQVFFSVCVTVLLAGCGDQGSAPYRLIVEGGMVLCNSGVLDAGFPAARAEKVRVHLPAGEYELPTSKAADPVEGERHSVPMSYELLISLEYEDGLIEANSGDGELYVENLDGPLNGDHVFFWQKQPVVGRNGRVGSVNIEQREDIKSGREFILGPDYDPEIMGAALWWEEPPHSMLGSCAFDFLSGGFCTWRVEYEGGSIDLEWVEGYWRWPGSVPIAFRRATGTYAGTPIDEDDFFRLVFFPSDIYSVIGNFAVRFETPIGGACGIGFRNLGTGEDPEFPTDAVTLDCDLNEIEPLEIVSATLVERPPPT